MERKVLEICSSFWNSSDGIAEFCEYVLTTTYEAFLSDNPRYLLQHILNHAICNVCKETTFRSLAEEFGYARLKILLVVNMLYRLSKLRDQVTHFGRITTLLKHNAIQHYIYTFNLLELEQYNQTLPLNNWMEALCGISDLDGALFASWLDRLREICNDIIDQDASSGHYIRRSCIPYKQFASYSNSWTQVTECAESEGENNSLEMASITTDYTNTETGYNMIISKCMCSVPKLTSTIYQILTEHYITNPDEVLVSSKDLEYMEDLTTDEETEYMSAEEDSIEVNKSPIKTRSLVEVKSTPSPKKQNDKAAGADLKVMSPPKISKRSRKLLNTTDKSFQSDASSSALKWQLAEEVLLYQFARRYHPESRQDWSKLSSYFPGRSSESLRRKWSVLKTKKYYCHNQIMPRLKQMQDG